MKLSKEIEKDIENNKKGWEIHKKEKGSDLTAISFSKLIDRLLQKYLQKVQQLENKNIKFKE